jgi:3-methyladenine DNA glycosylase AlkD
MNKTEALKRLKAYGTAQNRKVYGRHGFTGEMFGVSYANLAILQKEIKQDQKLADQLWAHGNLDGMVLATKIADPSAFNAAKLDQWVKNVRDRGTAGSFSNVVGASPAGKGRVMKWIKSKDEWIASCGWYSLCDLTRLDGVLSQADCEKLITHIEKNIHKASNWVRYAMNSALISLGIVSKQLEKKAVAAAKRIGKVEVDHGQTNCKTPDAATYIPKAADHARKKAAKQAAKKKGVKKAAKKKVAKKAAKTVRKKVARA